MKTITIILSIILIISCKKEDNNLPITKVSGTVVSTGSQKTVEGVLVYLYDGMPDGGLFDVEKSSHTHNKDSVFTNKDGYFELEVYANEPIIRAGKKGYIFEYQQDGALIGFMPVNSGANLTNVKLNLDALAYFNPVLMNKLHQKEDDYLICSLYGRYTAPLDEGHFAGNGPFKFFKWDSIGDLVLGDSYSKYKLVFLRDGVQNTVFDSVYIAPQQIYTDTIYY